MLQNLIVNQVKNLIKKAISRYAKKHNVTDDRCAFWIYFKNGYPGLRFLIDLKAVEELEFKDLATPIERMTYKGMGFDVATQTPEWIYKFMVRVSEEKRIDISVPCYYLRVFNNDLLALMFINGKKTIFFENADDTVDQLAKYKISIDYILETR